MRTILLWSVLIALSSVAGVLLGLAACLAALIVSGDGTVAMVVGVAVAVLVALHLVRGGIKR